MLKIYRRHSAAKCSHKDRAYRRCSCPLWADGTLAGKRYHKTLHTRNWERAQKLVQDMEAAGRELGEKITIKTACESFIRDAEARKLRPTTVYKYRLLFRRLAEWATNEGLRYLSEFDLENLRRFRETWPHKNFALRNQTERLRSLFTFAHDSGWILANTAKKLKSPTPTVPEVVPFTKDEISKIIRACDRYTPTYNAVRLRALVLLLLHSGLRIGDAVTLQRSKIADGRLVLRTQKKGVSVSLPLPPRRIEGPSRHPRDVTVLFHDGRGPTQGGRGKLSELPTEALQAGRCHRCVSAQVPALVCGEPPHPAGACGKRRKNPWALLAKSDDSALFNVD